jgi:hypothetical protein
MLIVPVSSRINPSKNDDENLLAEVPLTETAVFAWRAKILRAQMLDRLTIRPKGPMWTGKAAQVWQRGYGLRCCSAAQRLINARRACSNWPLRANSTVALSSISISHNWTSRRNALC